MGARPTLVLAGGSLRREQLLTAAGFVFEMDVPHVDETGSPREVASTPAVRLARRKALEVGARVGAERWVLGVDTVVWEIAFWANRPMRTRPSKSWGCCPAGHTPFSRALL